MNAEFREYSTVLVERQDTTVIVRLHRPAQLNAFDSVMRAELRSLWVDLRADLSLRSVIVTGSGRAFCAGADAGDLADEIRADPLRTGRETIDFLPGEWLDVPVIVAANGLVAGGGLHFVADADLVVAERSAYFTDPHVSVGQVSAIEPVMLVPLLDRLTLSKLVLLGKDYRMTADEAAGYGLVSEVVDDGSSLERALEISRIISMQSPEALRRSRRAIRDVYERMFVDKLDAAWHLVVEHWSHPDAAEGPKAFLDRRMPNWTSRLIDDGSA